MLTVRYLNRRYYLISTGNSREGHNGKDRAEEIRQDFFIGNSNLCLGFYLLCRLSTCCLFPIFYFFVCAFQSSFISKTVQSATGCSPFSSYSRHFKD